LIKELERERTESYDPYNRAILRDLEIKPVNPPMDETSVK